MIVRHSTHASSNVPSMCNSPLGRDGYFLLDRTHVYCLNEPLHLKSQRIDYFHGDKLGIPICQTCTHKHEILSVDMINASWLNPTIRRLSVVQRRFRDWYWQQWTTYLNPLNGRLWAHHVSGRWYYCDAPWQHFRDPKSGHLWRYQLETGCALWCVSG